MEPVANTVDDCNQIERIRCQEHVFVIKKTSYYTATCNEGELLSCLVKQVRSSDDSVIRDDV